MIKYHLGWINHTHLKTSIQGNDVVFADFIIAPTPQPDPTFIRYHQTMTNTSGSKNKLVSDPNKVHLWLFILLFNDEQSKVELLTYVHECLVQVDY